MTLRRKTGGIEVAGTPAIVALRLLYAVGFSMQDEKYAENGVSPACGGRLRDWKRIDETPREEEHHHQPLRPIHLSQEEIRLKKRGHP